MRTRYVRFLPVALALALAAACAQAPVQQMSDARQALQAAAERAQGASELALIEGARQQLVEAEKALEAGRYDAARTLAEAVRERLDVILRQGRDASR